MKPKEQQRILNIILLFVLLQPFLDVLSRMAILSYIPRISTYLKPLFVFGITAYLIFKNPKKKQWLIYIALFAIFVFGHTYLLYKLLVDKSIILHEFRFIVNIAYMISLYISFDTLVYYSKDKETMYRQIKLTVLYTFILYFILYLLAIITHTAGMTYEIADKNKLGFKGWYDSSQILGHTYSIMLPLLMYTAMDPKRKWYTRALIILLFLVSISFIGTKVPYYMTAIVLVLYIFVNIFVKAFNREHKFVIFNVSFIILMLAGMALTYKYTPVKYNTDLNNSAASMAISTYDLYEESGYYDTLDETTIKELYQGEDTTSLIQYSAWSRKSSEHLIKLFEKGKVHPSNTRLKQIKYAAYKYHLASLSYKVFGLGFLNQNETLALESDFTMALFAFGVLGLILFLAVPIKEFIMATIYILRNIKTIDLETYMIYMGLGIFFCISIYAGYTYIYTNFSIFLMLLITMLKIKRDVLRKKIIKENKISFLLLHLGYGGIETSTVNTANTLCNEYEVELISFYNLKKNQVNRIDSRIKIKYLYQGEPNRDIFIKSLKEHKILKTLKEGLKAVDILFKKKFLLIREIRNCNAKYIISTRYDFSTLLSKYGYLSNIKIAEEHHYHNNNQKYIKILSTTYYNIDYLCALTKTLYDDYHKFLKNNYHTKIILMPNMLYDIPHKQSKLTSKNIITMSRFDYGKKNDDIIKAFAKLKNKDWHLYLLGDGTYYETCKDLVKELKLEDRVFLPGYVAKENLEDYLLNSSIFVMASITEGLPMVLLEAMSYGIPCVAYETASGVNDIITNDYNGYVIKNRDEEAYVKTLEKIIKDKKLLTRLSKNARTSVERFSRENILKKWNKLLKGDEYAKEKKKN